MYVSLNIEIIPTNNGNYLKEKKKRRNKKKEKKQLLEYIWSQMFLW